MTMSCQTKAVDKKKSASTLSGKYLTFKMGTEMYGVQIFKIQEVIKIMDITHVPRMPNSIRGVINLRGKVIPIAELRRKFGMDSITDSDRTCIVVVQIHLSDRSFPMGIIIDEISEVLNIESDHIEKTPSFGSGIDTNFILGIGKINEKVIVLLDIDKVLSEKELDLVEEASD